MILHFHQWKVRLIYNDNFIDSIKMHESIRHLDEMCILGDMFYNIFPHVLKLTLMRRIYIYIYIFIG